MIPRNKIKVKLPTTSELKSILVSMESSEKFQEVKMTPELELTLHQVFQNPMLLHKLSEYLPFPDLLTCRQVNKSWKIIATKLIKKRDSCQISLNFDSNSHQFQANYWRGQPIDPDSDPAPFLHELNVLLKKSDNFPSTDFTFHGIGNLGDSSIQEFFNFYGNQIKSLTLSIVQNQIHGQGSMLMKMTSLLLQGIFQRQCLNLEKLYLMDFSEFDWPALDPECQFNLNNLTCLNWTDSSSNFAHRLIEGAGNLKIVMNFKLERDLDLLIKLGKISTIKKFTINGNEDLTELTRLATAKIQLTNLSCNCLSEHKEFAGVFELILESSKNTLEILNLSATGGIGIPIRFPSLKKIQKLILGHNFDQPCFPRETFLNATFEHLKVLDCTKLCCRFDSSFAQYFPPLEEPSGCLMGVKTLIVSVCSDLWMEKLRGLCPNFHHVTVNADHRLRLMLLRIFRLWTHVEILEIKPKDEAFSYITSNLDSIFTGFAIETCERLKWKIKNCNKPFLKEKGFKRLRISRSINELKALNQLRLVLNPLGGNDLPISILSNLYGFSLMENLQVDLVFRSFLYGPKMTNQRLELFQKQVGSYAQVHLERKRRSEDN